MRASGGEVSLKIMNESTFSETETMGECEVRQTEDSEVGKRETKETWDGLGFLRN